MLTDLQKNFLLRLAREVIRAELTGDKMMMTCPDDDVYREKRGGFVTLHKKGELRGCIGYVVPFKSLYDTVKEMALAAAFRDPRFHPVEKFELDELKIEISVLSELIPVNDVEEIKVGRDGLMITRGLSSGLLLPQVAVEWHWDVTSFLEQTCVKAGLAKDDWEEVETEIFRFTAEVFSEKE